MYGEFSYNSQTHSLFWARVRVHLVPSRRTHTKELFPPLLLFSPFCWFEKEMNKKKHSAGGPSARVFGENGARQGSGTSGACLPCPTTPASMMSRASPKKQQKDPPLGRRARLKARSRAKAQVLRQSPSPPAVFPVPHALPLDSCPPLSPVSPFLPAPRSRYPRRRSQNLEGLDSGGRSEEGIPGVQVPHGDLAPGDRVG